MKTYGLKESGLARRWVAVKRAFTLVELLVVISIIALLMAILMPALSKARESGRNAVCRSRLKQLGVAVALYAQENDNALVTQDWISPADPGQSGNFVHRGYWYAKLAKYIQSTKGTKGLGVFVRCPSGDAIKDYGTEISFENKSIDYGPKAWIKESIDTTEPGKSGFYCVSYKITEMKEPARFGTIFDFFCGNKSINLPGAVGHVYYSKWLIVVRTPEDNPTYQSKIFRHNGGINSVFGDGHVANIRNCQWKDLDPSWTENDPGIVD